MKARGLAFPLLVGALAAVIGLTVAAPAGAVPRIGTIENFGDGKCLQPENDSLFQGAAIVQEPCDGSAIQNWEPLPVSGTIFRYRNQASQLCLDARGGATNGTPVQQWTCNAISNEKWDAGEDIPDVIPPLISQVAGTHSHCLDVPGAQPWDGLAMQIYACNGTVAQLWYVGF